MVCLCTGTQQLDTPLDLEMVQRRTRILLVCLALSLAWLGYSRLDIPTLLRHALESIQGMGGRGAALFVAIYTTGVVLLVPGSILSLGAGAIYGVWWGSVLVTVGALIGSTISFLLGRHAARDLVQRKLRGWPRFSAINAAVEQRGLRLVFLLRLSPLLPYNLLNYVLGVTRVSTRDYLLGGLGILPGVLMFVGLGAVAGRMVLHPQVEEDPYSTALRWSVQLVALILGVAVTAWLARIANDAIEDSQNEKTPRGRPAAFPPGRPFGLAH
jgi:uncharacterized membrane protein YdjX (TVP38/TMEM64 family)